MTHGDPQRSVTIQNKSGMTQNEPKNPQRPITIQSSLRKLSANKEIIHDNPKSAISIETIRKALNF